MKKTVLSLLLCLSLLLTAAVPAFAAAPTARLYNVYGHNMLFQRDTDAVLAGEAPNGSVIRAELYNQAGALAAEGETTAANGRFRVVFPAPAGSYETYTVFVSCNGTLFAALGGVVFGELWLAAGQSNMEYPLYLTQEGKEMKDAGVTGPHDVYALWLPNPQIDGVSQTRYLPQTDAVGAYWFSFDHPLVYNISAPAYWFAIRLQQTLDMPVGVMCVPLGGSAIAPWLSRKAIDASPKVKQHLIDTGSYYDESRWESPDCAMHLDMTNLYNVNIAPLLNFRPQGVIWYQGCSEIFLGRSTDYYRDCFDLLQDSYTADFGYTRGRLPFVFTQLACYDYGKGPFAVTAFNEVFTDLAKADPASRAEATLYDLSLAFNEMGAIHPMTKKPVGERMALLAQSLVYGKKAPTSAAYCKQAEAKDGAVYLTFENVGDGLRFVGGTPRGFAVCGKDGVAVEAQAELVSADTVRVFSPSVPAPAAATYAAGSWSERANLWSCYGGDAYLPAAPFGVGNAAVKHLFADNAWMNCEDLTFFKCTADPGYTDAWTADGCTVGLETRDKAEGDGALRVVSQRTAFTLSPHISDKINRETVVFDNVDPDWSDYGTLRLQVKNCGGAPVSLNGIRLYPDEVSYLTPVCLESGRPGASVPADGAWHTLSFDLNRLKLLGVAGTEKTNDKLTRVGRIQFRWEGADAELLLDDICVQPEQAEENQNENASFFARLWTSLKEALAGLCARLRALFHIG